MYCIGELIASLQAFGNHDRKYGRIRESCRRAQGRSGSRTFLRLGKVKDILTRLGGTKPMQVRLTGWVQRPYRLCDLFLREEERRVLTPWATSKTAGTIPSVQRATGWFGKVGDWLASGKQDHSGTGCIRRGLVRLRNLVQGYLLALQIHGIRDGP